MKSLVAFSVIFELQSQCFAESTEVVCHYYEIFGAALAGGQRLEFLCRLHSTGRQCKAAAAEVDVDPLSRPGCPNGLFVAWMLTLLAQHTGLTDILLFDFQSKRLARGIR